MVPLVDLWLPVVAAAAFVFVVSSVVHMVLQVHKDDHVGLPAEEAVLAALRQHGVGPGNYVFPHAACMKDMGKPEVVEKFKRGPVGFLRVMPSGVPAIGKALLQWFLFSLLVGVFAAYVGSLTLAAGSPFMLVLRVTSAVAVAGYALGDVVQSIWKSQPWGTTFKFVLDGLAYGITTGATFAWLWPDAAVAA